MKEKKENPTIATHREARHFYEILESLEAGIVLVGCEVKSLRDAQCSLAGSFARFEGKHLVIQNLYIAPYLQGNRENPEPTRLRKLLLHKKELLSLSTRIKQQNLNLIPLCLYNKGPLVKVQLALARSKKQFEKKEAKKRRDIAREAEVEARGKW